MSAGYAAPVRCGWALGAGPAASIWAAAEVRTAAAGWGTIGGCGGMARGGAVSLSSAIALTPARGDEVIYGGVGAWPRRGHGGLGAVPHGARRLLTTATMPYGTDLRHAKAGRAGVRLSGGGRVPFFCASRVPYQIQNQSQILMGLCFAGAHCGVRVPMRAC